MSGKFIITIP